MEIPNIPVMINQKKVLPILGIIAAGALLISFVLPPMVVAQQGPSEFKFEYTKSGGIAGINERIAFESQASFDSGTKIIKFYRDLSVIEKRLSDESAEVVKQAISDNNFFELDGSYPPKDTGVADYFSYSLTITLNGTTHSVSWVDDFASSVPVPEGLKTIVASIVEAYASASDMPPPLDNGRRRITETVVRQSTSHDANGHSSHQAAYLLLAQQGYLYGGAVTFSSTKPVDILVYHDVTGERAEVLKGVAVHVVNGRSFAVTPLLKNVTSGSVDFVGSGILAHTTASDQYAIVATVDALRKLSTTQATPAKSFTAEVSGESFAVRATDSQTIQQLTDNYNGMNRLHVTGKLVRGDGGFNQPWSWHLDPATVRMAEISIELCDGRPSMVEDDPDYWLGTVGTFCPWGSKVVGISG